MVKLYIEGGGDFNAQHAVFKKAFSTLLNKVERFGGKMPRLVAAGGRDKAYKAMKSNLKFKTDYTGILLVDSEDFVRIIYEQCQDADAIIWAHLNVRDKWVKPQGYISAHVFLMVCAMENWMLADPDGLSSFFGSGFALPNPPQNPENLSRVEARRLLETATRKCKNYYDKSMKSFGALAHLDPKIVADKCPSFKHFIECLPI